MRPYRQQTVIDRYQLYAGLGKCPVSGNAAVTFSTEAWALECNRYQDIARELSGPESGGDCSCPIPAKEEWVEPALPDLCLLCRGNDLPAGVTLKDLAAMIAERRQQQQGETMPNNKNDKDGTCGLCGERKRTTNYREQPLCATCLPVATAANIRPQTLLSALRRVGKLPEGGEAERVDEGETVHRLRALLRLEAGAPLVDKVADLLADAQAGSGRILELQKKIDEGNDWISRQGQLLADLRQVLGAGSTDDLLVYAKRLTLYERELEEEQLAHRETIDRLKGLETQHISDLLEVKGAMQGGMADLSARLAAANEVVAKLSLEAGSARSRDGAVNRLLFRLLLGIVDGTVTGVGVDELRPLCGLHGAAAESQGCDRQAAAHQPV